MDKRPTSNPFLRLWRGLGMGKTRSGFGIAPILYMLGLVGVGAGILFSSYSQSIKSNISLTNSLAVKNDLSASATTLASSAVLNTPTGSNYSYVCPPQGGVDSASATNCTGATNLTTGMIELANVSSSDAHLPANHAIISTDAANGSPIEVGIFAPGAGVKQLDPWGHYYIYCRWENAASSGSSSEITIISAGPDGILQSNCAATTACNVTSGCDDLVYYLNVSNTLSHATLWQVGTTGSSVPDVRFGNLSVDANGDLSVPGTLTVAGLSGLESLVTAPAGVTTGAATLGAAGDIAGTTGTFSSYLSADNNAFQTGSGGTFTAANGSFAVGTGGALTIGSGTFTVGAAGNLAIGGSGAFTVDASGNLTIGSSALTVSAASGNTSIGGALQLGGITSTIGAVHIGTTTASGGGTPVYLLSIGTPLPGSPATYPFYVDQNGSVVASSVSSSFIGPLSGNVTGNVTGNLTGNITGATNIGGQLTGTSAVFTGSVQASSFIGNIALGSSGGATVTGILPISNGGTGGNTIATALTNLTNDGSAANIIPGTDLQTGSVTSTQLSSTGVGNGSSCNYITVDGAGRVTSCVVTNYSTPTITDNNGEAVTVGSSAGGQVTFTIGNTVVDNISSTGTMLGTSAAAVNQLDVDGNASIGTAYIATPAPPSGLIVAGSVGIGTSSPVSALTVNGTVTAVSFSGSGAGLTGIGTASISGTISTGNGGTGTNVTFTPGSVVFAGTNGIYTQNNANFFWDNTNDRLGIGTSAPTVPLQIVTSASTAFEIDSSNVGAANIVLNNTTGHTYTISALGATNYPGEFLIKDNTSGYPLLNLNGPNGSVALGGYASPGFVGLAPANSLVLAGSVGIGTYNPIVSLDLSQKSDALALPYGSTSARPTNLFNGEIRYNTSLQAVEAYVNNAWVSLLNSGSGVSSGVTLGTSASAANPERSGEGNTGFYSAGSGLVDVTALGSQIIEWSNAGENIIKGALDIAGVNGLSFPTDINQPDASIAIGSGALANQPTTASTQTAIGLANAGVYANTAVGYLTLGSTMTTAAVANTALGFGSLNAMTSGSGNTAIGFQAGKSITTSGNNIAIGPTALFTDSAGGNNIAIGYNTLYSTTGSYNTAVGVSADARNSSGAGNTALGYEAMFNTTNAAFTGSYNTAVGYSTLLNIQGTAANNTALGYQSGNTLTTGSNNTILGYNVASTTLSTGSSNILIGNSSAVDTPLSTTSNFLNIANTIYGTNIGTVGVGSVGIGTVSPGTLLNVYGDSEALRVGTGTNNQSYIGFEYFATGGYDRAQVGYNATAYGSDQGYAYLAGNYSNKGVALIAGAASSPSLYINSAGKVGIGSSSPIVSLDLSQKADAVALPYGASSLRPTGTNLTNGEIRYNTGLSAVEYYNGSTWVSLQSSGSSSGIYLGASASTPNPAASASDLTTGLYTSGTGHVDITSGGSQVADFSTSGENLITGNLGIGTSSPTELITAIKSDSTTYLSSSITSLMPWTAGASAVAQIYNASPTDNDAAYLDLAATNTAGNKQRAYIGAVSTTGSTTYTPALAFGLQTGSAAYNEYMRIGTNGFVGIGTTTLTDNLDVISPASTNASLNIATTSSGYYSTLKLGNGNAYLQYNSTVGVSLYENDSNPILFLTNNNEKMRITSVGSVGIGTTTPQNKLDVFGGVAVGSTSGYAGSGTAPASGMIVAGSVGIGIASPQDQLHVAAAAADSIQWASVLQNPGNYPDSNAGVGLQLKTSSYITTHESSKWSGIAAVDDTGTTYGDSLGLAFYTHNGNLGFVNTEVARITSTGNLGIGTSSPASSLEVLDATSGNANNQSFGQGNAFQFETGGKTTGSQILYGGADSTNHLSYIQADQYGIGPTTLVLNNRGGSVGIGTISPGSKLQINGNAAIGYATNTAAPTNGMIVAGSVGIGTASPSYSLDVYGGYSNLSHNYYSNINPTACVGDCQYGVSSQGGTLYLFSNASGGQIAFVTKNSGGTQITPMFIAANTGNIGIGSSSPIVSLDLSQKSDAVALPYGASSLRPTGSNLTNGEIRYNTGLSAVEYYNGSTWVSLESSGASSGIYLGTAASYPNPAASASDLTTGLYTSGTGHVDITSGGTQVADFSTSGITISTGNLNVAIGSVLIGSQNGLSFPPDYSTDASIAIGSGALAYQPLGTSGTGTQANTAIGYQSMGSASMTTAARFNTAVGYTALHGDTTGNYNTAIGRNALNNNTTGQLNTAVGNAALNANTTNSSNAAFGDSALIVANAGLNTAIGAHALLILTSGNSNTALGYGVGGGTLTTGSYNILIGVGSEGTAGAADTPASSTSNYLNIGNTLEGSTQYATGIGSETLYLQSVTGSVNYVSLSGGATGTGPTIATAGGDTNINLTLSPKGSGNTLIPTGSVGIGTTNPLTNLHILNGTGSGQTFTNNTGLIIDDNGSNNSYFALQVASGGAGKFFNLTNAGNVGIGTTAPGSLLQVGAGGSSGKLLVDSSDGSSGEIQIGNPNSNSETSIEFVSGVNAFGDSASSSGGGAYVWNIGAGSWSTGGTKFNISNSSYGGPILTAQSNGYVGIGTTAPIVSLDLSQKQDAIALPYGGSAVRPTGTNLTNGEIRYNTGLSAVEYYNGSTWVSLQSSGSSSGIYLGASASTPNPAASASDTTTGLYTSGAGHVDVSSASSQIADFSSGGFDLVTGKLTIGTTTPIELVTAEKADSTLYVSSSTTLNQPWTAGSGAVLQAYNTSSTSADAAYLNLSATNASGNEQRAYVGAVSTAGSTTYTPSLAFGIQTGSTAYNEYMRIGTNGNVGIGTTLPGGVLDVWGSGLDMILTGNDLQFNRAAASYISQLGAGSLNFTTSGGSSNIRMTITSIGSVGIGTISPGSTLQINGNAAIGYATNTAAPTNGMIVAGSVGIGTSSPDSIPLTIYGSTSYGLEHIVSSGSNAEASLGFRSSNISNGSSGDWVIGTNMALVGGFSIYSGASGVGNILNITSGGSVGIGTATISSSNKLEVNGAASIGYPNTYGGSAGGMIVAGSVGIGTNAPSNQLNIFGTSSNQLAVNYDATHAWTLSVNSSGQAFYNATAQLYFQTAGATKFYIDGNGLGANASGGVYIGNASGVSTTAPVIIPDKADTTTGFAAGTQGNINAIVGGTEVMRWTSNGIGIGSSSPIVSLDLSQKSDALALPYGATSARPANLYNGEIRYNTTLQNIEAYVNNTWVSLLNSGSGVSAGVTLGISTSAANPARSGETTTGFYTAGSGLVDVTSLGSQIIEWSNAGENIVKGSLKIAGQNGISFPTDINQPDASIAIGSGALANQPTTASTQTTNGLANAGSYGNTAVGYLTLGSTMTTAAVENTALGFGALNTVTSGSFNTGIGWQAGSTITSGGDNIAIGIYALNGVTGGNFNIGIGHRAFGKNVANSSANVGVGYFAGENASSAYNTAIGFATLGGNTTTTLTGNNNTAIGYLSLGTAAGAAANNTALGYQSGNTLTTGSNNTILGYNVASTTLATGSSNILIGTGAAVDTPLSTTSNFLNIGNVIYGINIGTVGVGSVGIGTASPLQALDVNGIIAADGSSAITSSPPTVGTANGWKMGMYGNTVALGVANWTIAAKTAQWFSVMSGNPANNGTSTTPDTGAGVSLGANGNGIFTGSVGIGTTAPIVSLDFTGKTDAILLPQGASSARPTNTALANGEIRYNTGLSAVEYYNGSTWVSLQSSGSTSGIYLGASASTPNPAASASDTTTGLYTSGAGHVDVTSTGTQVADFSTTGITISTGNLNVAIGSVLIGSQNGLSFPPDYTADASIAIGSGALTAQTIGTQTTSNIAIGYQALGSSGLTATAIQNTAIGYQSLYSQTTGKFNTAIGYKSLTKNTTNPWSTAVGANALVNSTGYSNTAIGYNAGSAITSGVDNTTMGDTALANNNTTGSNNTAIGFHAMLTGANLSGGSNTSIGAQTFNSIQGAAANNSALGYDAGYSLTTGSNNTILGANVGSTTLATGSNNILIGAGTPVDTPLSTTSNFLNIANLIYGINIGTQGQGSVGIGTAAPSGTLDIYSTTNGITTPQLWVDSNTNNTVFALNNSQSGGKMWVFGSSGGSSSQPSSFYVSDGLSGSKPFAINSSDNVGIGGSANASTLSGADMVLLSTGSVGIGTTSPFSQLSNTASNTLDAGSVTGIASTGISWAQNGGGYVETLFNSGTGSGSNGLLVKIASNSTYPALSVDYGTTQNGGGTALFRVLGNGNVGIGTTTPQNALDVYGGVAIGSATGYAGTTTAPTGGLIVAGSVGIGTANPAQSFAVQNSGYFNSTLGVGGYADSTRGKLFVQQNNATAAAINATQSGAGPVAVFMGGSVGIGTTVPIVSLDFTGKTDAILLPQGASSARPTSTALANGEIRYNTGLSAVEYYNGSVWVSLQSSGSTSGIYLGTAANYTNPSRNGDLTTGLYTANAGEVDISGSSTQIASFTSSGINIGTGSLKLAGQNGISFPPDYTTDASIAIGSGALASQPLGTSGNAPQANIAIGYQALGSTGLLATAVQNTAVGYQALQASTSANQNTAIGFNAMLFTTSGNNSTAVGAGALNRATSASANTALGAYSAYYTTGNNNTMLGYDTGTYVTTGNNNTALGQNALEGITGNRITGSYNTAVGNNTLVNLQSAAANNTALGYYVGGGTLTTGSSNILIGVGSEGTAGAADTPLSSTSNYLNIGNTIEGSTQYATAIGSETLYLQSVSGSVNYISLSGGATGTGPTLATAGSDTTINLTLSPKGSGNTLIPTGSVGIGTTTPKNALDIAGAMAVGTAYAGVSNAPTNGMIVLGSVGIGMSSPTAALSVAASTGYAATFNGGYVGIGTTSPAYALQVAGLVSAAGAFQNLSDARLKKDVMPIGYGLGAVDKLRPVGFNWIKQDQPWQRQHQIGFIAQEVEPIVPEVVTTANDSMHTKSIAYASLVPVIVRAVQELHALVEHLQALFDTDHAALAELKAANDNQARQIDELRREFEDYRAAHP